MTLGFVIGESKPTLVTAQTSRSLPIGEYVIIDSKEGKIVGLAEKSVVSSAALGDVNNYDEALESIEVAFLTDTNNLFDFKGLNHSFTLEIFELVDNI